MTLAGALQTEPPVSEPAESQIQASGEFPRSVNWANPRVAAILETAASCFSKGGFTATTLADIGKELGLRKSIVHYYFASKAALVQEVQSFSYGRYLDAVRRSVEGAQTLGDGLRGLFATLSSSEAIRGLNIELWSEGRRDSELSGRAELLSAEARRLLSEHLASFGDKFSSEEREGLADAALALLDGLTVLAEREGKLERAERAFESFVRLLEKA